MRMSAQITSHDQPQPDARPRDQAAPAARARLIEIDGGVTVWVLPLAGAGSGPECAAAAARPEAASDGIRDELAERRMEAMNRWTNCDRRIQRHRIPSAPVVARGPGAVSSLGRLVAPDAPATVRDHAVGTPVDRHHDRIALCKPAMRFSRAPELPPVAMWRIHMLRLAYLLMAGVMGPSVWQQVLFQIEPWPVPHHRQVDAGVAGTAWSVLGAALPIADAAADAARDAVEDRGNPVDHPAGPLWFPDDAPDMQVPFGECIGIVAVWLVMPWRRVALLPAAGEAWRRLHRRPRPQPRTGPTRER